MSTTKRDECITDDHLTFLDALRESGVTNIYEARPCIKDGFNVGEEVATKILVYWMKTFGQENR